MLFRHIFLDHLIELITNKCRLDFTRSLRSQPWWDYFYINLYFYAWSHGIIVRIFILAVRKFHNDGCAANRVGIQESSQTGQNTLRTLQAMLTNNCGNKGSFLVFLWKAQLHLDLIGINVLIIVSLSEIGLQPMFFSLHFLFLFLYVFIKIQMKILKFVEWHCLPTTTSFGSKPLKVFF